MAVEESKFEKFINRLSDDELLKRLDAITTGKNYQATEDLYKMFPGYTNFEDMDVNDIRKTIIAAYKSDPVKAAAFEKKLTEGGRRRRRARKSKKMRRRRGRRTVKK
jgi:hypothetical protein